ncbi:MAG TPA: hypothetical protein VFG25_03220 [Nitrosopumilaceae archaeon]|nr:hypothetical protein [Nitrosopumilaceae archaeon]
MNKNILIIIAFIALSGLLFPTHIDAQTAPSQKKYADAVNEANECKKTIDSNPNLTEAEKIVAKRKCSSDSAKKYVGEVTNKDRRLQELKTKNLIQCETWYSSYTIATLENFRVLKPVQLVDDCIVLYNDPIWKYSEKDRFEKLMQRANELSLFKMAQIKAELFKVFPPQKQVKHGILPSHVDCKEGKILIYKISTGEPACVKLDSVDKILKRLWGYLKK